MHKNVAQRAEKNRELQRHGANKGSVSNFAVSVYVLVSRRRRSGTKPKLVGTWTNPWRIVTAEKEHEYRIHGIVTGEVLDVRVGRLQFYVNEVFQH